MVLGTEEPSSDEKKKALPDHARPAPGGSD